MTKTLCDLDAELAAQESRYPGMTPGTEKRILWAGSPGQKTPLSLVYVHGFSASSEELRPLPDLVAEALGANLHFTRLTGHALSGVALGEATLDDWRRDVREALAIGRKIGERCVVISCSTGSTLAALALAEGEEVAGTVMISPNFRLRVWAARLITWPGFATWGPWLVGREREFIPLNAEHARLWTTRYPTQALIPMARAVVEARKTPFDRVKTPAMFLFDPEDRVIDFRETARIAEDWGGPVQTQVVRTGIGCDPDHHVIAGEILSPDQTEPMAQAITEWIRNLGET